MYGLHTMHLGRSLSEERPVVEFHNMRDHLYGNDGVSSRMHMVPTIVSSSLCIYVLKSVYLYICIYAF